MIQRLGGKVMRAVAGVLLLGSGLACDWVRQIDDPHGPLAPTSPTSSRRPVPDAAAPDAVVVVPDAAAASDAAPLSEAYTAMCSHYCNTLQETDLFACTANGRTVQVCRDLTASTTGRCFDLRCVPQRVDLALCFTQCEVVANQYANRCPVAGDPADSLCTSSQAAHDAACRAGCVL